MQFQIYSADTAPAGSKGALQAIESRYGFVPNLAGVFAESPGALSGLLGALKAYDDESLTLSHVERQIVMLAVSIYNRCVYCTAAHSMLVNSLGLSKVEITALQQRKRLRDSRLEALRCYAEALVENNGRVSDEVHTRFLNAGFTQGQILEVILGISLKTLTNYANHAAEPAVNAQFQAFLPDWSTTA